MVLAVGIFLAVICVVSSGLFAVRQTWEKVKKHNGSLERLQRVDRVIDSAFRNVIPFKWHDENNKSRQIFLGRSNSLQMAYQHRIGKISDGGIRYIAFEVRDEKLLALYRKTPIIPWLNEGAELTQEILAENVAGISFQYADKENDEITWLNNWDEENPNIPLAIQITIEWNDGRKESWLRRTAGSGLNESLGARKEELDDSSTQ
jgi:hypothetical protein